MAAGLGQRFFRGMLVTSGGAAAQAVLRFTALVVLARLLTPESFGIVAPIAAFYTIVAAGLNAGVVQSTVQRETLTSTTRSAALHLLLGGATLLTVAANVAIPLVFDAPEQADHRLAAHLLSAFFLLRAVHAFVAGQLSRELAFKHLTALNTAAQAGYLVVAVILALLGADFLALVFAFLAQHVLFLPAFRAYLRELWRRASSREDYLSLIRFGGPMSGSQICNAIAQQIDQVAAAGHGVVAAGLYNRGSQLAQTPAMLLTQVTQLLGLSAVGKVQNDPVRLASVHRRATTVAALVGLPTMAFAVYDAESIITFVLGGQWAGAAEVFMILAFAIHVRFARRIGGWILAGTGHPGLFFKTQLLFVSITAVGAFVIGQWSLVLLAWSVTASRTFDFLVVTAMAMRFSGLRLADILRAHAGGLVLAALVVVTLGGIDLAVDWEGRPLWLELFVHAAAAGGVLLIAVLAQILRLFGSDHVWLHRQLVAVATKLLPARRH